MGNYFLDIKYFNFRKINSDRQYPNPMVTWNKTNSDIKDK